MAIRNAVRECQAFHSDVRVFISGVLVWRSACGVPLVAFRLWRSCVAFRRSLRSEHSERSEFSVLTWAFLYGVAGAHNNTRQNMPLRTDINESSLVCVQVR